MLTPFRYKPTWPHEVAALQDDFARAGIVRSARDVDQAIQSAAEAFAERRDATAIPAFVYGDERWHEMLEDVLVSLEVDFDEVYEVAS